MSWQTQLNGGALSWLMDEGDSGIRYLAMRDLFDLPPDDKGLAAARVNAHQMGHLLRRLGIEKQRLISVRCAARHLTYNYLQNGEALVRLGYGDDPRLANAINTIREKQDVDGRWVMEYDYTGKTWVDFGKKKQPTKWVTNRAAWVLKNSY